MMTNRERAIKAAREWLLRGDLNPNGELALVAREFINEVSLREDAVAVEVAELPSWPFN